MSKICPNCQEVFDDNNSAFCSGCGSRLVEMEKPAPTLNLGDANAISGGVNINQSKNITTHDTHYHSTTVQAATVAKEAGVGPLVIGHYSSRCKDMELFEKECRSVFPSTHAASDGDLFDLPMKDFQGRK